MISRRIYLNEKDQALYRAIIAFLSSRLEEYATIEWALRLKPHDNVKRWALLSVINNTNQAEVSEPWRSAWRFIEESWETAVVEDEGQTDVYHAHARLRAGDRSGSLVNAIVDLVSPQLKIEVFTDGHRRFRKPVKRPANIHELFLIALTSGELVDPSKLGLEELDDSNFLVSLGHALDAVVGKGLDMARRIGWDGEYRLWRLGQLYRVYYVPDAHRGHDEHEPDEFNRGIAPSVKLLYATVARLVDIEVNKAIDFVSQWKQRKSPVYLRLWAALSRDPQLTSADDVGNMLLSLDDRKFWGLHDYPEIAELRSRRFSEIDPAKQGELIARLRKCPPRRQWPKKADAQRVKEGRLYWAVRELRRIELGGATLPHVDKIWLDSRIHLFPDLIEMTRIDDGFLGTTKAKIIPPNPDSRFDLLAGVDRLKALEAALSSSVRTGWNDDPAKRADDWMRAKGNPEHLISDLESVIDSGIGFMHVWEHFGWAHSPPGDIHGDLQRQEVQFECQRVLLLLAKLPYETTYAAIDGIAHWLSSWEKQISTIQEGFSVWFKIWPVAVESTNAQHVADDETYVNILERSSDNTIYREIDTLNSPAGKLVGVFLAACPTIAGDEKPFSLNRELKAMRDTIITASGRAGLIGLHRMIEALPYFLRADSDWTIDHLIKPLNSETADAKVLWHAIGRRSHSSKLLKIIGEQMVVRATDPDLSRATRRSLVFSLVVECLLSLHEKREPAVPYVDVTQMIRTLDDEIRAYGAEVVQQFVRDLSTYNETNKNPYRPEEIFRSAAAPFLQNVWPQERSLATPGVSRAFARLPASAEEAFVEAEMSIERYLVPFDCWSMVNYGLYGRQDDKPKLRIIDTADKAEALLRLLNLTIGTGDRSVIPHDLTDALDYIREIAPRLEENQIFRRLATAARRI